MSYAGLVAQGRCLQGGLHGHHHLMAWPLALDPVQRQPLRRNKLHRGECRNVELTAHLGRGVGIDQNANEFLRQADDLRIRECFARHLMAVVAPLGGEEQQ